MKYIEDLNVISESIARSSVSYVESMNRISEVVIDARNSNAPNFSQILERALEILQKNSGSHTDLDVLERVLDRFYDAGIIDSNKYEEVVKKSGCGRMM